MGKETSLAQNILFLFFISFKLAVQQFFIDASIIYSYILFHCLLSITSI